MNSGKASAPGPDYIDTFSPAEKALMRIGLYGFVAAGAVGMHAAGPAWGWGYLAFAVLGFSGPVALILCARCPYPYVRHTCLFVPPGLIARVYPFRPRPMAGWEKVVLALFFAALFVVPLPFLVAWPAALAVFLALALPTNAAVLLCYCPRCRNRRCPFNRVRRPAG